MQIPCSQITDDNFVAAEFEFCSIEQRLFQLDIALILFRIKCNQLFRNELFSHLEQNGGGDNRDSTATDFLHFLNNLLRIGNRTRVAVDLSMGGGIHEFFLHLVGESGHDRQHHDEHADSKCDSDHRDQGDDGDRTAFRFEIFPG